MFYKDNIVFEKDFLTDKFCDKKEAIIDTIYKLTTEFLDEFKIVSLKNIKIDNVIINMI